MLRIQRKGRPISEGERMTQRLQVPVTPTMRNQLLESAAQEQVALTELVRMVLADYLARMDNWDQILKARKDW